MVLKYYVMVTRHTILKLLIPMKICFYLILRTRWAWHASHVGEIRNACNILVGIPEGKELLVRRVRRVEGNIMIDMKEIVYGVDWIHLTQDGISGGLF
jgi:hypothetical protein